MFISPHVTYRCRLLTTTDIGKVSPSLQTETYKFFFQKEKEKKPPLC